MADRVYEVFVLNVTFEDTKRHNLESYRDLFLKAYRRNEQEGREKRFIPIDSEHEYVIPPIIEVTSSGKTIGYQGRLVRFVKLGRDIPWFNLVAYEIANEDDIDSLRIPVGMRPHYRETSLLMNAEQHKVVIAKKRGFLPRVMQKVMKEFFGPFEKLFGKIVINIEQSSQGLQEILDLPILPWMQVIVERPNPDSFEKLESRFARRLENMQVSVIKEELRADDNGRIIPDRNLRQLTQLALSNGEVKARGGNEGEPIRRFSTKKRPFYHKRRISFKVPRAQAFAEVADAALTTLKRILRSIK